MIIAKNQTASPISLPHLGIPNGEIPASGQVTLTDFLTENEIYDSAELKAAIQAGDVILNDGSQDLNQSNSIEFATASSLFDQGQTGIQGTEGETGILGVTGLSGNIEFEPAVGFLTLGTTTGNISVTGLSFQPKFVTLTLNNDIETINSSSVSPNNDNTEQGSFGWGQGFAIDRTIGGIIQQCQFFSSSSASVNAHRNESSNTECIRAVGQDDDGVIQGRLVGALTSFNSDGFTINITENSFSSSYIIQYMAYPAITSAEGPRGVTGLSSGPQGVTGLIGVTGIQGIRGDTGVLGNTGNQGTVGNTGFQGATGISQFGGSQGDTGLQGATGLMSSPRQDYGVSATDPVASPSDGDKYYNSALQEEMYYDGTRSKWLSVATYRDGSGTNGSVTTGTFLRRFNGMVTTDTTAIKVPKGTLVYVGLTRTDTDAATLEVRVNGSTIFSLPSSATNVEDTTVNVDFDEGVMALRNATTGNTMSLPQAAIVYKRRI